MGKIIHIDNCSRCPDFEWDWHHCSELNREMKGGSLKGFPIPDDCPLEDHPIDKYWSDEDDMIIGIDKGSSEGDHSAEITFDISKLSKEEREITNKPINLNGRIDIQEMEDE